MIGLFDPWEWCDYFYEHPINYKTIKPLGADFNLHTNGIMEEKKLSLGVFYLAKASLSACYSFSLQQFCFILLSNNWTVVLSLCPSPDTIWSRSSERFSLEITESTRISSINESTQCVLAIIHHHAMTKRSSSSHSQLRSLERETRID
jgi:hypothetical protein